ncbi:unnamed protein product [Prunus armeniaca]|uniref:Uncharacterized protein n=1 Tax=Prunus armeniaca TaxID=36596 RepID=A0A6J5UTR4_PRUAR|nr:unnamed protein product [Prunus armeniaca]
MEQCRQGKSAKWIRNLGKRIGSEGWARGSQSRTRRLSVGLAARSTPESGSPRAGRGTDWERSFGDFPRASNSRLRTGTDKGNPTV